MKKFFAVLLFLFVSSHARAAVQFDPDDLLYLFPVDELSLSKAKNNKEIESSLKLTMPQLSDVLSESNYQSLLAQVLSNKFNDNNLVRGVAPQTINLPFSQWFITGIRFEYCGTFSAIPPNWLQETTDEGIFRWSVCRPTIRLTAQPFGLRNERDSNGSMVKSWASDDKSFHFVFNFTGSLSQKDLIIVENSELDVSHSIQKLIDTSSSVSFSNLLAQFSFTEKDQNLLLRKKLRAEFREQLNNLKNRFSSASKSTKNEKSRILISFIQNELKTKSMPLLITQLFSNTGLEPSSDNSWSMAQYKFKGRTAHLKEENIKFNKQALNFLALNTATPSQNICGVIQSGYHENFANFQGNKSSFDFDLTNSAQQTEEFRDYIATETSLRSYITISDNSFEDELETNPENLPSDDFKDKLNAIFNKVNDPNLHSAATQPCISCHVVPGLRETLELPKDKYSNIPGNRLQDLGLILEQQQLTPVWNLRQLGYFGRNISIGERILHENVAQIELINSLQTQNQDK